MGTYEVTVEHGFRARHAVRLEGGQYEEPHEHDWLVSATFRAERLTEPMGAVIDFLAVGAALEELSAELEGTDLNDLAENGCSAERLAEHLAERLIGRLGADVGWARLHRLAVREAHGCWAAFYPEPHGPGHA